MPVLTARRKVVVTGGFMIKYLKTDDLLCCETFVKVLTQSGAIIEGILDDIKPVLSKKPMHLLSIQV